jgi:hypothetical protein
MNVSLVKKASPEGIFCTIIATEHSPREMFSFYNCNNWPSHLSFKEFRVEPYKKNASTQFSPLNKKRHFVPLCVLSLSICGAVGALLFVLTLFSHTLSLGRLNFSSRSHTGLIADTGAGSVPARSLLSHRLTD